MLLLQISELKHIRSLASEITSRGATLYDLLRREVDLRVGMKEIGEVRRKVEGRDI